MNLARKAKSNGNNKGKNQNAMNEKQK